MATYHQFLDTKIADLLGFNDLSTFSRKFKAWTGRSPSAFQKQTQSSGRV
ncbi:MAG: helix-turn-helix domain-containing protein [Cyanobacteria bacterium P01_G01_bin.54]